MKVLIVAKTTEICENLSQLLADTAFDEKLCLTCGSVARGTEIASFDAIIVSTPLSDEFGLDFVAEITREAKCTIVVLTKGEIADEVQKKLKFTGAFVLARPFNKALLIQTLKLAEVASQNMLKLAQENKELNRQLSDMKMIERAKAKLIQYLKLSEEQAHRHIQEQSMNLHKSRREVAEDILKKYQ